MTAEEVQNAAIDVVMAAVGDMAIIEALIEAEFEIALAASDAQRSSQVQQDVEVSPQQPDDQPLPSCHHRSRQSSSHQTHKNNRRCHRKHSSGMKRR